MQSPVTVMVNGVVHLGIVDGHAQVHVAEITPVELLLNAQRVAVGWPPESSQVSALNPAASTISVSPSHRPTE